MGLMFWGGKPEGPPCGNRATCTATASAPPLGASTSPSSRALTIATPPGPAAATISPQTDATTLLTHTSLPFLRTDEEDPAEDAPAATATITAPTAARRLQDPLLCAVDAGETTSGAAGSTVHACIATMPSHAAAPATPPLSPAPSCSASSASASETVSPLASPATRAAVAMPLGEIPALPANTLPFVRLKVAAAEDQMASCPSTKAVQRTVTSPEPDTVSDAEAASNYEPCASAPAPATAATTTTSATTAASADTTTPASADTTLYRFYDYPMPVMWDAAMQDRQRAQEAFLTLKRGRRASRVMRRRSLSATDRDDASDAGLSPAAGHHHHDRNSGSSNDGKEDADNSADGAVDTSCPQCGKSYRQNNSFYKHLYEHHAHWQTVADTLKVSKHQQVMMMQTAELLLSLSHPLSYGLHPLVRF